MVKKGDLAGTISFLNSSLSFVVKRVRFWLEQYALCIFLSIYDRVQLKGLYCFGGTPRPLIRVLDFTPFLSFALDWLTHFHRRNWTSADFVFPALIIFVESVSPPILMMCWKMIICLTIIFFLWVLYMSDSYSSKSKHCSLLCPGCHCHHALTGHDQQWSLTMK